MPSRILLGVNDEAIRHSFRDALAAAGYEVIEASDGEEVLQLLRVSLPRLMLLDLVLPRLSGGTLIKRLTEEHPTSKEIPLLILITEKTLGEDLDGAHAARPNCQFMKADWDMAHVIAKVNEVLKPKPTP